jgi:hypothetical protein
LFPGSEAEGRVTVKAGGAAGSLGRVGAALLVLVVPALSTAAIPAAKALSFDPAQLSFETRDGLDVVSLEGADFTTEPGAPLLPAVTVRFLLPPGAASAALDVRCGEVVRIPGSFAIAPAPRPATFSSGASAEIPQRDAETYSSALPYPREIVRLAGVGSWSGCSVATVIVTPLQFVPATGELLLHTDVTVTVRPESDVEGAGRADLFTGVSAATRDAVAASVENAGALSEYEGAPAGRSGDPLDYLIVCPDGLAAAFEPLAAWKTMKGVRAGIVTLDDICSDPAYSGADAAAEVRNCIAALHAERGVTWVLLGGDTGLVPARNAYDPVFNQGIPCDLYYADLDGTWNDDGDARWGEPSEDGIDMYADVYVGRAPVENAAEAEAFVEKVLLYEGGLDGLPDDYQLDMLFLGEVLWDSPSPYTDGAVALDLIESESVPPRFAPITKLYESDSNLSASRASAALGEGYGVVFHEGHANIGVASVGPDALTIPHLDALRNAPRAGVWYSVGCWSAAIDHDTFGEHWVTNPSGGGVAYVGNSRYGWGCPGYPGQCVSDLYGRQFARSLFVKGLSHAGLVHADAKHQYAALAHTDNYMRYAMYELNLLGDPEMPIWTDGPRPLTVDCVDALPAGSGSVPFGVVVTSGGAPVAGATVCVSAPDLGIYEVAVTDAAGAAAFSVPTDAAGLASVVVTSPNALPHSATLAISAATGVVDGGTLSSGLSQNCPNPFVGSTGIAFALARPGRVSVAVYDVSGRRVATLAEGEHDAGSFSVSWDGRDDSGREVAAGAYFVRMVGADSRFERKMTLLR